MVLILVQVVVFVAKIAIRVFSDNKRTGAQGHGLIGQGPVDEFHRGDIESAHLAALVAAVGADHAPVGLVFPGIEESDDDAFLLLVDGITVLHGGNRQVTNLSGRGFVSQVGERHVVEMVVQDERICQGAHFPGRRGAILQVTHAGGQFDTHEIRQPGPGREIECGR